MNFKVVEYFIASHTVNGSKEYENCVGTELSRHTHCGMTYVVLAFGYEDGDGVFIFDINDLTEVD